jgi:AraC family transcriptional regulator
MDWIKYTNDALDYIEDHLQEEISLTALAQVACSSSYHFPAMFSAITGISLAEYIRRRRLSQAALDLRNSDLRIVDVAVKYGYSSADAFSRAFQKLHGIAPSAARQNSTALKMFPKLTVQIVLKGATQMEYRIEKLDFASTLTGLGQEVVTRLAFRSIPRLWREARLNGFRQELIDLSWKKPKCKLEGLLGVVGAQATITDERLTYFMGVRNEDPCPAGWQTLVLPPATWAVFPNVVQAWKRLYSEWLPNSGVRLADLPIIECYYRPDHTPKHELWVPIVQ